MRLHLVAATGVIIAGILRGCSRAEWLALTAAITMVLAAEALDTAPEQLCDYACEGRRHLLIKNAKDIAAGAVLIAAAGPAVTGVAVFFF